MMKRYARGNKYVALIVCFVIYGAVFLLCWMLYPLFSHLSPLLAAALLDIIATVLIFAASLSFNNSSIYDPYWSVAPVPIVIFWSLHSPADHANPVRQILIISLIVVWAVRLTWNWARRWHGFSDEDWRYAGYRVKFGKAYWIISFTGIHLFPTLIVFTGLLPVYGALTSASGPFSFIDAVAGLITLHAIILEMAADEQLRIFARTNEIPGKFLRSGLWKYSRHPNYLGEISFWFGLFLFSLASDEFRWWYLAGPIAMILLFRFISVPMIERRMKERKPGYDAYRRVTSPLLPWPVKWEE